MSHLLDPEFWQFFRESINWTAFVSGMGFTMMTVVGYNLRRYPWPTG